MRYFKGQRLVPIEIPAHAESLSTQRNFDVAIVILELRDIARLLHSRRVLQTAEHRKTPGQLSLDLQVARHEAFISGGLSQLNVQVVVGRHDSPRLRRPIDVGTVEADLHIIRLKSNQGTSTADREVIV